MRIALTVTILLISSVILPSFPVAEAAAVNSITVTDLSIDVQQAHVNQQVSLSSNIQNNENEPLDYIAIFETRDNNGITTDIMEKEGQIDAGGSDLIQIPWKSDHEGSFTIRVFFVENSPELTILSYVKSMPLIVTTFEEVIGDDPAVEEQPVQEEEIPEQVEDDGPAKYTVMIYMVASDLESGGYAATYDIEEMIEADVGSEVNVIVQTGGSANSTIDEIRFIDFTTVQRHEIKGEDSITVMDLGQQNMGDYRTLSDFITWSFSEYPAEKYAIILWDHGNGIRGFGHDDIYDDVLTIKELEDAFSRAKKQMGTKFEVIGFDACLMATFEVAMRMSYYGNYMVASEELEPGWGWDYTAILSSFDDAESTMNGEELGRVIADSYVEHSKENTDLYEDYDADRTITLSVIDLSKVADISDDIKSLGERLEIHVNYAGGLENAQTFARVVQHTERYGIDYDGSAGYTDLYELVGNIDESFSGMSLIVKSIQSSIEEAVVYNVKGEAKPNAHGLSIFLQLDEYQSGEEHLVYLVSEWLRVIEYSVEQLSTDNEAPSGSLDYSDGIVEGTLYDGDIHSATISIYKESTTDTKYEVISLYTLDPSRFLDEDGSVSYELDGVISLCNDELCSPAFVFLEDDGDTQFAYFPVRLESSDGYNEYVSLIYEVSGDDFVFLGAWEGFDEDTAQKGLRPLYVGDRIYTYTQEFDEEDENYFVEIEYEQPEVTEDFGPEYTDYDEEYTLQMRIYDFAGNYFYSDVFEL